MHRKRIVNELWKKRIKLLAKETFIFFLERKNFYLKIDIFPFNEHKDEIIF